MPAGKGTYGSKVGRPPEKKKKAPKRKAMTSLTKMTTVPFKKLEVRKLKKVKLKNKKKETWKVPPGMRPDVSIK